jgi:hypothetical protein
MEIDLNRPVSAKKETPKRMAPAKSEPRMVVIKFATDAKYEFHGPVRWRDIRFIREKPGLKSAFRAHEHDLRKKGELTCQTKVDLSKQPKTSDQQTVPSTPPQDNPIHL